MRMWNMKHFIVCGVREKKTYTHNRILQQKSNDRKPSVSRKKRNDKNVKTATRRKKRIQINKWINKTNQQWWEQATNKNGMEWNEIWAKNRILNVKDLCSIITADEEKLICCFFLCVRAPLSLFLFGWWCCFVCHHMGLWCYDDDGDACMRERISNQVLALMLIIMIIDFDETTTTRLRQNDEVKNICSIPTEFVYAKCGRSTQFQWRLSECYIFIIIGFVILLIERNSDREKNQSIRQKKKKHLI